MSEVAFPEGFTARTATGGDVDDITAVFAAGELAVNGEVDVDTEDVTTDLRAPLLAEPDHAVVVVEWASDRVVAASILHAGNGDVWANVHPERRGRGIGTSWPPADPPQPGDRPGAVLTAFRGFHGLGRRVVTLGTDSRTRALPMYERVGMRVRRSSTSFVQAL